MMNKLTLSMKFLILFLMLFVFITCTNTKQNSDDITLNKNGDTVELILRYPSNKLKEIVSYRNNKPFANIGFYENGDTIKQPTSVFIESDSTIFAYIPLNQHISSANIYLGMDSIKWEQPYYLKIHESVTAPLVNLKRSVTFRLRYELVTDGELVGVFACLMDTGQNAIKNFQFRAKLKPVDEPMNKVTLKLE